MHDESPNPNAANPASADMRSARKPDWTNAATCIENMQIAYDEALEADVFDDGNPVPTDTVVDAGDLGVLIGLAEYAVAARQSLAQDTGGWQDISTALEQAEQLVAAKRDGSREQSEYRLNEIRSVISQGGDSWGVADWDDVRDYVFNAAKARAAKSRRAAPTPKGSEA